MRIVGKFNKISDKLKKTIPVLKNGEVVTFFMLTGVVNNDPDSKEQRKWPIIYPKCRIPTKDKIFDPYLGDNGEEVEIGVPDVVEKGEVIHTLAFWPGTGEARFMGRFSLVGGRGYDNELFEYFWLTNHRDNPENKNRNTSIKPLFQYLDVKKESLQNKAKDDVLFEAMKMAREMNLSEMREFIAALNIAPIDDDELLASAVSRLSMEDPSTFLKHIGNPDTKVKATIKKAQEAGAIKYDQVTGDVLYGNNNLVLASLSKKEGSTWLDVFAEWIRMHQDGKKVFANLEELAKGAKKAKKTELV